MSNVELKGLKGLRNLTSQSLGTASETALDERIEQVSLALLVPGQYQPRKHIKDTILEELINSIKTQGIIQPLIVRKTHTDKYEIVAGERRWRAAKQLSLKHVPVIIRDISDKTAFAFAIIENIQRENLNPIEEALAFARFRDEFSMKHDEIAQMIGRSRASVTNTMRLLALEPEVRSLLEEGGLGMGHARALLTLEASEQLRVAKLVVDRQLNVRATEKLVQAAKEKQVAKSNSQGKSNYHGQCKIWSQRLSKKFSTQVTVKLNEKGNGKVIIQVNSPEEIDWLIEHVTIEK